MYLELFLFTAFVFFAILDVKSRQIKVYWFVLFFVVVLSYKLISGINFYSEIILFGISAIFILAAYASKLFGTADLLGILLFCFALPYIGPFPSGISLLIITICMQTVGIASSNVLYNVSDLIHNKTLFPDVPRVKKSRIRLLFWSLYARRKRDNDSYVLSAQQTFPDGTISLSIKRGNKMNHTTKYVFSGHPQFVYLIISYGIIWFASLAF